MPDTSDWPLEPATKNGGDPNVGTAYMRGPSAEAGV